MAMGTPNNPSLEETNQRLWEEQIAADTKSHCVYGAPMTWRMARDSGMDIEILEEVHRSMVPLLDHIRGYRNFDSCDPSNQSRSQYDAK